MNLKEALLKDKNKAYSFDTDNYSHENALNAVAQRLNKGAKIIQFYFKSATDSQNIELGFKLRQLCSIFDALLIVNSRADIAQIIDADGICLFENDMTLKQAKKIFHNDVIFAKYYEKPENTLKSIEDIPDYICADFNNISTLKAKQTALNKIKIIELDKQLI